jgi:hypothetical protein
LKLEMTWSEKSLQSQDIGMHSIKAWLGLSLQNLGTFKDETTQLISRENTMR